MSEEGIKAKAELSLPEWFEVWKSSLWIKYVSYCDKIIQNPIGNDWDFVYLRATVDNFDVLYADPIDRTVGCSYEGKDYDSAKEAFLAYCFHIGSDTQYIESLMPQLWEVELRKRSKFYTFCSFKGADIQMNLVGAVRVYDYSFNEVAYLGKDFYEAREIFCGL